MTRMPRRLSWALPIAALSLALIAVPTEAQQVQPNPLVVLNNPTQVASVQAAAALGFHMLGSDQAFVTATTPASRQYLLVHEQRDTSGHVGFPVNFRSLVGTPVRVTELGVDPVRHTALIGIGIDAPAGTPRLAPMTSGDFSGQMTYYLRHGGSNTLAVTNCLGVSFHWDSVAQQVSNAAASDCGSIGNATFSWSLIPHSVSLIAVYNPPNNYSASFAKNSEYHYWDEVYQSYSCEADYRGLEVIGSYSGNAYDNTSTLVPSLFSPNGKDLNCPYEYYTTINRTW